MTTLARTFKISVLELARTLGVDTLVARSRWRQRRLLVLCYHGVAIDDEHDWQPSLYMSQERFRGQLRRIRDSGCHVLRLDDAVERLCTGTLPPRAVVITVDDGAADFRLRALPVLEEFGFPATVYLTTYYCGLPFPVWTTAGQYVLWKGRELGRVDGKGLTERGGYLSIATPADRAATWREIHDYLLERSTAAKDEALSDLASRLGVDYTRMRRERILQIMTPEEVAALPRDLIDIELHTHRHRTPLDDREFTREILDNRRAIEALVGHAGKHFCYPSGRYDALMFPWLRHLGVRSATTCVPGLATADTEALQLPRLVSTHETPDVVFDAWLSGVAAFLPRGASTRPSKP